MYDVIVIGAGPAGCMASKKCSELGLKTLMIEKKIEIGSPLKGYEIIFPADLDRVGLPLQEHWIASRIKRIVVDIGDAEASLILDDAEILSLETDKFVKHLAALSSQAGTEIRVKSEVTAPVVESGQVVGVRTGPENKRIEEECGTVIYAGGYDSPFLDPFPELTMPRKAMAARSFQQRTVGDFGSNDTARLYIDTDLSSVSALIPKGENVANAIHISRPDGNNLEDRISGFLAKILGSNKFGSIQNVSSDIFERLSPARLGVPGLIIAGDAAGVNIGFWPFGIGKSMLSGISAGEAALEIAENGNFDDLSGYEKRIREISEEDGSSELLRKISEFSRDSLSVKIKSIGRERHMKGKIGLKEILGNFL